MTRLLGRSFLGGIALSAALIRYVVIRERHRDMSARKVARHASEIGALR